MNLNRLLFLNQSQKFYIMGEGPSSSSVMWCESGPKSSSLNSVANSIGIHTVGLTLDSIL